MINCILQILILIAGFVLLVKGSDYFVDGSASLAAGFGIPQLVIGLTVVAMGTSAPEAAVSITAAFRNNADICVGNIVGSNILNVWIILGIASAMVPIRVAKSTIRYEIPFMILCSILLVAMGYDGFVSRPEGVLLLTAFAAYLIYLFVSSGKNKEEEQFICQMTLPRQILYILGGMAAIILGSKLAVYAATNFALLAGVSERFIGLTIVALGTSLPELFTSVVAARKGNADIAMGNIVGSNIFNILFILGLTSMITKVPYARNFIPDGCVMAGAGFLLLACVVQKKQLTRVGGILMLVCYAGYFTYLCQM